MGKAIRLRYTGIVAFLARLSSIATGFAFTILVTRNLTVSDFGLWQYISILFSYLLFPNMLINYWSTRFVARGYTVGKTHLCLSLMFSTIAIMVFLSLSIWSSSSLNADIHIFIVASITLPFIYLAQALEALASGHRPDLLQYGFMLFEISKIIFGIFFVLLLKMGFYGVLISVMLAYATQATFLAIQQLRLLMPSIDWKIATQWIKSSWLPAYALVPHTLMALDAFVVTMLAGSTEPIAYWRAAQVIFGMVGYSVYLASALYPKLLSGGGVKDIEVALKLVLMFIVPMVVGAFTLAKPLLGILRSDYIVASDILRIGIFATAIYSISNVLGSAITGLEEVDKDGKLSFHKLLRSKLFLLPSINMVTSSIYIIFIYIFTQSILSTSRESAYLSIPFYANVALLIIHTFTLAYLYILIKRSLNFSFPKASLLKYVAASSPMAVVFYLYPPSGSIMTVVEALLGGCIYFSILFVIDKESRELVKAGMKFIQDKFSYKNP